MKPTALKSLWLTLALLTAAFAYPLYQFASFALTSGLYSYLLLIPVVSLFFVWQARGKIRPGGQPARKLSLVFLAAGLALIGWFAWTRSGGQEWQQQDYLSAMIAAWLLLLAAACLWFLDTGTLRVLAFPLGFLIFMIPLPTAAETWLETFLQHGSALAARLFFKVAGTPYVYENLTFHLPAFTMQVAPQCSGIRSSLVLLVTSAVAAHLFLRHRWTHAVLMLAVIPLGLLRNGLRAFTIGELCVRIGPEMSDSWIHHNGGPLFFALSLPPLFLLLYLLAKTERKRARPEAS